MGSSGAAALLAKGGLASEARHVRFAGVPLSSRSLAFAALAAAVLAVPARAQERRTLDPSDPQAQLLGYYAAAMTFTPVGLPRPGFSLGGALGLIPDLSAEEQRVGFGGTKGEDANRCPVYPRLSAGWMARGGFAVEAGYTPAAEVCGVQASVVSAAVSYRFALAPTWDGVARVSLMSGSVEGDFTCSAADTVDAADLTCYGGSRSADRIAPTAYGFDVAFARRSASRRFEPYLLLGFARERVDFDVNYTRGVPNPGNLPPLDDHERMRVTFTRAHAGIGAGWQLLRFLNVGGEVYYEPGAMLTARGSARVTFGGPR
jgi:hypothetical protein